jgi:hypothetical protein
LLAHVLERWDDVALPECWLVAGAIAQTFWNCAHNLPAENGIDDIDIVYFDDDDISEESEIVQSLRVRRLFDDLPVRFDVRNEARVHLWYEQKFGYALQPYTSTKSAIDTFPTTATTIGLRPSTVGLEAYASFGYEDLVELVVRPNKTQITRETYQAKVQRWKPIWPLLRVIDWDEANSDTPIP